MESELIDNLEELIEEVWKEKVRGDVQGDPQKINYEADLVAAFYHHLRSLVEDRDYGVRLGLERKIERHSRQKKSKGTNDLHIISCESRLIPSLIGFEFKCSYNPDSELKGDIGKLWDLSDLGVDRGYLCVVFLVESQRKGREDTEREYSQKLKDLREMVRKSWRDKKGKDGFLRLAHGIEDEGNGFWEVVHI